MVIGPSNETDTSILTYASITAANDFFTRMFNALGHATAQIQLIVAPVINELDPPVPYGSC